MNVKFFKITIRGKQSSQVEMYLEPTQTTTMKLFLAKIDKGF